MRKAFMVVAALSLMLVSCSESNIQKAQNAAELVKQNCGIIVSVADIAAAFSAVNPVVTTVAAMAHAICAQAERTENGALQHYMGARVIPVQVEQPEPPPLPNPDPPEGPADPNTGIVPPPNPGTPETVEPKDDCVAVVNGVCIREEGDK